VVKAALFGRPSSNSSGGLHSRASKKTGGEWDAGLEKLQKSGHGGRDVEGMGNKDGGCVFDGISKRRKKSNRMLINFF